YQTIIHPFTPRPNERSTIYTVLALDLLAMVVTAPFSYVMEVVADKDTGLQNCLETWEKPSRVIFGTFTNVFQFYVPFTTIVICYARIMVRLQERRKNGIPGSRSAKKRQEEEERAKRTNRMLIAMVIIFGTSWFPINLINLVGDLVNLECWEYYYFTFFICHVGAMSSTCYNPILYGWLNSSFRTEFSRILPCLKSDTPVEQIEMKGKPHGTEMKTISPPEAV
ncbi:neuropeptide F receptor, partial [Eurytemora carolleeae]|uniref:neuropeptide F receptor n=1 Tax=Eurytemora carolleeae TaxID=1294199 RepID=UPI000C7885B7